MEKHSNGLARFTYVTVEGPTGTGKSYLASLIHKFIPTTIISINDLLLLSSSTLNKNGSPILQPDYLFSYLSSNLPSTSEHIVLIIDDFDLFKQQIELCQSLSMAIKLLTDSYLNNKEYEDKTSLFVMFLMTTLTTSDNNNERCKFYLARELPNIETIQFNLLNRDHVRECILKEAFIQNIQPSLTDEQIKQILNSLSYTDENDGQFSKNGCKQISSILLMQSRHRPQRTQF